MNYKNYSSEGFVIGRKNFSEADRIVVFYTKDFGKVSLIAKGVRKLTSRKRGGIEIFSKIKFSAVKTNGLDILTEVSVIDGYDEVRANLRRISIGYYICEVIAKVTRDNETHLEIFQLMERYFEELKTNRNLKVLRGKFVTELLVVLGFWPEGKKMTDPDSVLESVVERKINSSRVGKKMLQQN
ncbi:hypothetical protein BH10PAT1_BH10PAT1_5000 [soil metagenome]